MQFDVELQIAIPGMKTSTTTITVEATTIPEAVSVAQSAVSVVATAVNRNSTGKPISIQLEPIELNKAVEASVFVGGGDGPVGEGLGARG